MEKDTPSDTKRLAVALEKNNALLQKTVSLPHVFLRGIIIGFAGFLGATILASILLSSLSYFTWIPAIEKFLQSIDETAQTTVQDIR